MYSYCSASEVDFKDGMNTNGMLWRSNVLREQFNINEAGLTASLAGYFGRWENQEV